MSLDLATESQKDNLNIYKSFKIRTITYDNEERINNCNTIKIEDNTDK